MTKVEGKHGVSATVLCDSVSEAGVRLTTFELEYPRIVHSELMTHRMLSKNAASSRAIPAAKMREQLTARPVRFGKNVSGMQDAGEHNELINGYTPQQWWHLAMLSASNFSNGFAEAGYHKQVFNRLTESFQMMKTVCTATEFENFFWLRNHDAADPTIAELARCMYEAREQSTPMLLKAGEWHLPYLSRERGENNTLLYGDWVHDELTCYELEDAIKVSCARCAAVSFRNVDYGIEKSREVFERLVGDERKHASALEHQATPIKPVIEFSGPNQGHMQNTRFPSTWEDGISHMDRNGQLWSGNFKGWVQYRKLVPGESKEG